jgi:exo-1,4-beta-D-glucosaminidase
MSERLGPPRSLADYVEKAQLLNYEAERAMFEAFSRNKYRATGIIQWMMQNAWPSLHWNLFDWFLSPNGSFFGAKKANEPLHIQYSYDDRSVVVVNQTLDASSGAATAKVFDLDGSLQYKRTVPLMIAADTSSRVFTLPRIGGLSTTYFVELLLRDPKGEIVSRNVYWLSTTPERLAWSGTRWYYTPTRRYADFRALSRLPTVRPAVSACTMGGGAASVTLANRSSGIAFFVRVWLTKGARGQDLLPISWSDDYVTLMPGERTTLVARYRRTDLGGTQPTVVVRGWNVSLRTVTALPACG